MSDAEPRKSSATSELNPALRALARLLARQAARQFLAEKETQALAPPMIPAGNVLPASSSTA